MYYQITIYPKCLSVNLVADDCSSGCSMNGELFSLVPESDGSGFYDYLRDNQDLILGLRYWVHDGSPLLVEKQFFDMVANNNGMTWNEEKLCLMLYFDEGNKEFIEDASCDQDFGLNILLKSETGNYMLVMEYGDE